MASAIVVATLVATSGTGTAAKPGGGGGGKPTTTTSTTTRPTTTTSTTTTTPTTTSTTTTTTVPASGHDPIVFVHGWNSSATAWNTMLARFKADGYTDAELFTWSYDTGQSNRTTAAQLAAKVDAVLQQTGRTKVDVISHSMGAMSSRWYVKFLGGDARVDDWVSLAGANHGTDLASFCFSTACSEMRPGSSFLTELNAGDESPGTAVTYLTWWSPCDEVINPDSSALVAGAVNTQTACMSHSSVHEDAVVYGQVRAAVS